MSSNSTKSPVGKILPVLFAFFVMGFCDFVGSATTYAKNDFGLSETMAGFLPSMVFIWFLVVSVPAAMLMNRIGRKNTVQLSNLITIAGMLVPFLPLGEEARIILCMIGFALLGIGNTILQVSLNPLLTNVVKGGALTSSLTAGQVIKAVSSFAGPIIGSFMINTFGNWMYSFLFFAAVTVLSGLWLMFTPIHEEREAGKPSTFGQVFSLLKDKTILLLFLGIVFVVGIDVGLNTVAPKLLTDRFGWSVDEAGYGSSLYFLCRTAGAFVGAVLLTKISDTSYFKISIIVALAAIVAMFPAGESYIMTLALIGVAGFACASIFSIIFALALKARPDKANEISGLMVTGICGGAVIPPLMGFATDMAGSQAGSLAIIGVCALYLLACSFMVKPVKA
jgi:fucose permease